MIIGIVGSRRRNSEEDRSSLLLYLHRIGISVIDKIVTGDCDRGGDKFARDAAREFGIPLDIKRIKDPDTGEEMDFKKHRWFEYNTMCNIFYSRNEEIAKEELDCLIALVTEDRKGGTENTIKYFRKYHIDWTGKLILL